jgi:type IV secretion system protein VirB1
MDPASLTALLLACAPQVDAGTARALVAVESGANPHAIGVVGGVLERQPRNLPEAMATAKALHAAGWNFSIGLAQINVRNLGRLGLSLESALEPCANLAAMQTILTECYERAPSQRPSAAPPSEQRALRQALSCYYSGNFTTGFDRGYVRRVAQAAGRRPDPRLPKERS